MVRGVSKQVIVVEGSRRDFFENAFFILKDDGLKDGINEKDLLRQARNALVDRNNSKCGLALRNLLWAFGGFAISCGIWVVISLF